jgi:hypothetical protein
MELALLEIGPGNVISMIFPLIVRMVRPESLTAEVV